MDGADARTVRDFFIHNALYWIEEFNLDGLRLDAVHAIADNSTRHILQELAERVRAAAPDRHVHLILENEANEAERLIRRRNGAPRWYTAQWNDDVHHVLHVAATGESTGYYAEYKGDTTKLARSLAEGFAFQGELMPYRGHTRGQPSGSLPPAAFVAFIQNHDQVGNRAFGDRLTAIASANALRAIAATYLLLPADPNAVHGRRMGSNAALPVFLRFRPGSGRCRSQRPPGRIRALSGISESGNARAHSRPALRRDLCHGQACLGGPLPQAACHLARLVSPDPCCPTSGDRAAPLAYPLRRPATKWSAMEPWWYAGQLQIRTEQLVLAANLHPAPHAGFPASSKFILWREGDCGDDGGFGPFAVRWSIETVTGTAGAGQAVARSVETQ